MTNQPITPKAKPNLGPPVSLVPAPAGWTDANVLAFDDIAARFDAVWNPWHGYYIRPELIAPFERELAEMAPWIMGTRPQKEGTK